MKNDKKLYIELIPIELGLESEDYIRVEDNIKLILKNEEYKAYPDYYLVHYYYGQLKLRLAMKNNKFRKQRIRTAIKYLEVSLQYNNDYPDAHMLLGYALITRAKLNHDNNDLHKALGHFKKAFENGNDLQRNLCIKEIEFIKLVIYINESVKIRKKEN